MEVSEEQRDAIRSVGPRIRLLRDRLSLREQEIAEDLLRRGKEVEQVKLADLARAHGVSQAMIVKLSRKLGFPGFRALRRALAIYNRLEDIAPHEEISPSDTPSRVVRKIFQTSIRALQDTLAIFDFEQFERAVSALAEARHRDIYGVGGSGAIAYDAYHKFLRIGIRAAAYTDGHLMLMSASQLTPQDVAMGVSHSGRTEVVIEAIRMARDRGARTIALTNYPGSPLASAADIVLCSTAAGSPLTGENAAARVVQLNIIDALFVAVALRDYSRALAALSQTMQAVTTRRVRATNNWQTSALRLRAGPRGDR